MLFYVKVVIDLSRCKRCQECSVETRNNQYMYKRHDGSCAILQQSDLHARSVPLHFPHWLSPCQQTIQGSYQILYPGYLCKSANAAEYRILAQQRTPQMGSRSGGYGGKYTNLTSVSERDLYPFGVM